MKNIVLTGLVVFVLGALISSCKSHEKCPAYGEVTPQKTTDVRS
jgi:hypothetical protein